MRFHRRYECLQRWTGSDDLRGLISPDTLAIARFEPTMQAAGGAGLVDLVFSDGNRIAVVPFIDVVSSMVLVRELTPIAWPARCRELPPRVLQALEASIVPWLQSLVMARQLNREEIRTFSTRLRTGLFEQARSANLLGAAPYARVLEASAPYVYAMRFAHGKRVRIEDPNAATGAALLAGIATVRADLRSDESNELARNWFGSDLFGDADEECDVSICADASSASRASVRIVLDGSAPQAHDVRVAHPVPTDVMISFDPDDSSPARTFGVLARMDVPIRPRSDHRAEAAGGSAGRILLLVRENWESIPDADVDEACALADRLRTEGFAVRVCGPATALRDRESADMVHVFTLHNAGEMQEAVRHYATFGTPIVASAALPRVLSDTVGAPRTLASAFTYADESSILDHLDIFELESRHIALTEAVPREGYAEAIRALLPHMRAVLVNSGEEEEALRNTYAFAGAIRRGTPLPAAAPAEPIAHLTGDRPFAFIHAPTDASANVLLLARAAAECGIPLAIAGPVVEPSVQRMVAEILGPNLVQIPRPSAGELESLYRTARVFIDLSWMPCGLSRVARAIACGCPVLISDRSHARSVWTGLATAAPGSFSAIREGLARLWESPAPVAPRPADEAFLAVITAYAQAQSAGAAT